MNLLPWFTKHKPKRFTEVEFSDDSNFKVLDWLKNHKNGGVLYISGAIGIGKTSLVYMAAKALKYKVFEYSEIAGDKINSKIKTIGGLSALILIDESDFPTIYNLPKFPNVPVVYTSASSIQDLNCIKIAKPDNLLILKAAKRILKLENCRIEDNVILRLCKICNCDFRSVFNYCQLFSNIPDFKDFKAIDRVVSHTISFACRAIFSKRLCFNEIENLYSEKVNLLCLNTLLKKSLDKNTLKSVESLSDLSFYPEKYKFLALDPINKIRTEFEYQKEIPIEYTNKRGNEDPLHFLPFYKRNLQDKKGIKHLQAIFETYKIDNLTGIDKEIANYIDMKSIESKEFKYKFVIGSSSAVKRDISICELLNL